MAKQTKCYRLEAHQVAAVQQLAKDNGESSESAAIRFIIDDWVSRVSDDNTRGSQHNDTLRAIGVEVVDAADLPAPYRLTEAGQQVRQQQAKEQE